MPGFRGGAGFKGGQQLTPPPGRNPFTGGQVGGGVTPPPMGKMPGGSGNTGTFGQPPGQTPPWAPPRGPMDNAKVAVNTGQSAGMGKRPFGGSRMTPTKTATPPAMSYDYYQNYPPTAPGGNSLTDPGPGTPAPAPTPGPPDLPMPGTAPPGGNPQPSMPYTPPPGAVPGSVFGARIHHDMGEGANYGQTRMNNGQKEMWGNLGGGGRYGWVPWDPRMQSTADNFSRYGSNWYSGSGATSMHTADIAQILRENLGREPTQFEIEDVYYGINRNVPGVAYNS